MFIATKANPWSEKGDYQCLNIYISVRCRRLRDYLRDVNLCQQHYRGDTNLYMIDVTLNNLFASA